MKHSHIRGIIPPLVTPFREDGTIDEQAHRAEVRFMVEQAKIHGLAVCGSTSEGHTLSTEETRRIVGWTVEEVKGRVPVIAGIITDSTQSTIDRARAISFASHSTSLNGTPASASRSSSVTPASFSRNGQRNIVSGQTTRSG